MADIKKNYKLGQITSSPQQPSASCQINLKTAGMFLGYLYDAPEFNIDRLKINGGHDHG